MNQLHDINQNQTSRSATTLTLVRAAASETTAAQATLPRRVDVHQIDAVTAELRSLAGPHGATGHTAVDASLVEMIDLASLRSLAKIASELDIQFVRSSVAFRATADYTGIDLGAAMPALNDFAEAA